MERMKFSFKHLTDKNDNQWSKCDIFLIRGALLLSPCRGNFDMIQ